MVLRWTIIGYLYQELLMLLRASASKQRLPTSSLVATYPQHKVPWQHSLCILTRLNSTHQRCSEILYFYVMLGVLWISGCFLRPNSGHPDCLPLQTGALPEWPSALKDPVSSLTTAAATAAGRARAEWPLGPVQTAETCTQDETKGQVSLWGRRLGSHRQNWGKERRLLWTASIQGS